MLSFLDFSNFEDLLDVKNMEHYISKFMDLLIFSINKIPFFIKIFIKSVFYCLEDLFFGKKSKFSFKIIFNVKFTKNKRENNYIIL